MRLEQEVERRVDAQVFEEVFGEDRLGAGEAQALRDVGDHSTHRGASARCASSRKSSAASMRRCSRKCSAKIASAPEKRRPCVTSATTSTPGRACKSMFTQ